MSSTVKSYLQSNPQLTKYIQIGLVNINSLARYIKENNREINEKITIAALGMDIRRQISQLPILNKPNFITSDLKLHIVIRTNLQELIFDKGGKNRQVYLDLFNKISRTKYFSCLVEGEKEIVLLTDYSLNDLIKEKNLEKIISNHTTGLSFISIDFPIKLRKVAGVYSYVTSALMLANISIHSFHTIGGEVLILVKNEDLIKAQEILTALLKMID